MTDRSTDTAPVVTPSGGEGHLPQTVLITDELTTDRRSLTLRADLADLTQVRRLADEVRAATGRLDVLVTEPGAHRRGRRPTVTRHLRRAPAPR
jgi:NAD(P)-dependent dehydrogenase (short-subunit alcohol dehydrogenase family)